MASVAGSRPRIVLGVSGGIAAYKACEVLRRLTESGHDVTVVPTAAALRFVGAPTWAALSGKPVSAEVWDDVEQVPHVRIGQEADLVREMSRHVDGIVLCSPRAPDSVIHELAQECVLALVNRRCGDLPSVLIDNLDGVRKAMTHLRALGHRTIAYVGGPVMSWSSQERLAAARLVAAEHPDTELIDLGSFKPYVSGGVAAADVLIASGATAVLAYNDLVALGLLERLCQRGVAVPRDISVVGVDNIPMAALSSPALTSVGIPLVNCGRAGVDVLVGLLRDPSAPPTHHHDLSFQLVVRESTGPLAAKSGLRSTA